MPAVPRTRLTTWNYADDTPDRIRCSLTTTFVPWLDELSATLMQELANFRFDRVQRERGISREYRASLIIRFLIVLERKKEESKKGYIYIVAINFVQRQGWDLRSWGARKVEEKPGGPSFRAAAILLRPANQAAGNAEQPYRGSTPSTLEHGSIARRDQPFDAREKHPPLSRERLETRSSTNNNAFRRKLLFFFSGRSNNSSTILQFLYLEREILYSSPRP